MAIINVDDAYILNETGAQVDKVTGLFTKNENATSGEKQMARLNIAAGGTNPNLLRNWYWVGGGLNGNLPVNQRGQTSYADGTYGIDGWVGNCTLNANYVTVNGFVYQIASYPLGVPLTFSVMLEDGSVVGGTLTITDTTTQEYFYVDGDTIQLVKTSGMGALMVGTSSSVNVKAVKLELGSVSTLANDVPPPYGEELTRCIYSKADPTDTYANNGFGRSNRNLLDNWYFVGGGSQNGVGFFPINQRCKTSYWSGYGIDRWAFDDGGSVTSTGLVVPTNAMFQNVRPKFTKQLLGRTLTASVLFTDGGIITGTQTFPQELPASTAVVEFVPNQLYSVIFPAGNAQIFRCITGGREIAAVKLEEGTVSTLVNDAAPDFDEQLRKCQRFFCSSFPIHIAPEAGNVQEYYATTNTARSNGGYNVPFPCYMDETPNVAKLGMAYVFAALSDGTENVTYDPYIFATDVTTKGFTLKNGFYNGFATYGMCWVASCEP